MSRLVSCRRCARVCGLCSEGAGLGRSVYEETSALWWWDQNGSRLDATGVLAAATANLLILGQDILTFLKEDRTFHATGIDLFYQKLFAIKVAWTISLELMFYAIAPFIVRKVWLVCAVLCVSLTSQLLTYLVSPMSTDWFSRIFPFALAYFMAGSLAYRAYIWLASRADDASARRAVNHYMLGSSLTLLLLTAFFDHLPLGRAIYLTATTLCLPGIVIAGRRIPIDGFLGDLSYPIYLVHPIFMIVIIAGSNPIGIPAESFPIAASLLISLALVYFVERPIDRYRQARVREGKGSIASITWVPRYAWKTPAGSDGGGADRAPLG